MPDKLTSLSRELYVDPKFAASAGYFLIAFSHLEEEMNRTIWVILNVAQDSRGHALTTSIRDFGQRMLLLARFGKAHLQDEKMRDDCTQLIRAIQHINDRRNELVHGSFTAWESLKDTAILIRSVPDGTAVRRMPAVFSTDYLCDLAEYTITTARAAMTLRQNLRHGTDQALPSLDIRPVQPR